MKNENSLFVKETFINVTENCQYGESEVMETWTNDIGKLFKDCQKEYGRCVSSIYRDTKNGTVKIGWVFEAKLKYTDVNQYYVRQTWVEVHTALPKKTIEYFYKELK
jgi:hypothetical protein